MTNQTINKEASLVGLTTKLTHAKIAERSAGDRHVNARQQVELHNAVVNTQPFAEWSSRAKALGEEAREAYRQLDLAKQRRMETEREIDWVQRGVQS